MPSYTEHDLQRAISAVQNGTSERSAAKKYGVPKTTLHDRLRGAGTRAEGREAFQRLSNAQEGHIRDWALAQAALGFPPTHQELRDMASRVLSGGGDPEPLGKHWVESFLRRNPQVSMAKTFGHMSQQFYGDPTQQYQQQQQQQQQHEQHLQQQQQYHQQQQQQYFAQYGASSSGDQYGQQYTAVPYGHHQ